MGWLLFSSQLGSNITGKRAAKSRTMRQLSLPAPMIMLACSSIVPTAPARKVTPTRSRLRKWRDGFALRLNASEIDDARQARLRRRAREGHSRALFDVVVTFALSHAVHEVNRGATALHGVQGRVEVAHVELPEHAPGKAVLRCVGIRGFHIRPRKPESISDLAT